MAGPAPSKVGGGSLRVATSLITCQPNCDCTGVFGVGAHLEGDDGVGERLDHLLRIEEAEIAAIVLGAGIERLFLGDRREIAALVELGDDRLGLVFGLHQDVARLILVGRHELGQFLVEALVYRLIGDRRDDLVADDIRAAGPARAQPGDAAARPGPCRAHPPRLRRRQLDIDQVVDELTALLGGRHSRQLIAEILRGLRQVGLGDRLAVDAWRRPRLDGVSAARVRAAPKATSMATSMTAVPPRRILALTVMKHLPLGLIGVVPSTP